MARYRETVARLAEHRTRIAELRREMRALQAATEPEPVEDYTFKTAEGPVRLSALFGDKDDLIVIHNMGRRCSYCTMWADGFNGVHRHLASRAAFVVSSPDPPDVQQRLAKQRGWGFRMVSHDGTSFAADMGYRAAEGGWLPGISAFRREGGRILRVSDAGFSPGDDFCTVWHVFDLLPGGAGEWGPDIDAA